MTTITLQEDIKTKKKLKDISESSWDKIILVCKDRIERLPYNAALKNSTHLYYNNFAEAVLNDANQKLVTKNPRNQFWMIASDEAFNDIKKVFATTANKFLSSREQMIRYATDGSSAPTALAKYIVFRWLFSNKSPGQDNDLFTPVRGRGDCCKIKSLEVFQFLKKYADDTEINIITMLELIVRFA